MGNITKELAMRLVLETKGLKNFKQVTTTIDALSKNVERVVKKYEKWEKSGKRVITTTEKIIKGKKKLAKIEERLEAGAISPKRKKALAEKERDQKRNNEMLDSITAKTKTYNRVGKIFNTNQAQTDKLMAASGYHIDKYGHVVNRAGKRVRNYTKELKKNRHVLSEFRMEYLGVMFAGMALNRAMKGLNATSRQWLGMGDLMSTMMGITMLGANQDLMEYGLIPMFDILTNLPAPAQKAIGFLSFALEGLGAVFQTGGQLMLGLYALKGLNPVLYAKVAGSIGKVGRALSNAFVPASMEAEGLLATLTSIAVPVGVVIGVTVLGMAFLDAVVEDAKYLEKLKKKMANQKRPGGGDITGPNAPTPSEQYTYGLGGTGGQGTMAGLGEEKAVQIIKNNPGMFDTNFTLPSDNSVKDKNGAYSVNFPGFQGYINKAVGGPIRKTGRYFLHEGEEVVPKTGTTSGQVIVNTTYNVNVSDKREFEDLLRKNNQQLTSEVRRMVKL